VPCDGIGLIETSTAVEALARQVPDSGGVVFIPALTGLGAPHWRSEARGLITGLTLGAAMLAGLATGFWHDVQELAANWREERRFSPQADNTWRETLLEQWRTAIGKI
jgi:glycerol kinase